MRSFRFPFAFPSNPPTAADIRRIIQSALNPGQCFASADLKLTWDHRPTDSTHWELFRGRALDHTQTRERRSFESWNIWEGTPIDEPLLSVKLDLPARQIHVTRSVLSRTIETYSEGGAILSRQAVRRIRELAGTIDFDRLATCAEIHDELIALLFFAVVGASRLPLTSVEAPLPEFSLGRFAFCYSSASNSAPCTGVGDWISASLGPNLAPCELSRMLEFAVRATNPDEVAGFAQSFAEQWTRIGQTDRTLLDLLRDVFNDVALSPYSDFVIKALQFATSLKESGRISDTDEADFLTYLLRQLGRHLTAFDLVRFHHRGANYPDALMLDEVFGRACQLLEERPDHFLPREADTKNESKQKRLRRRGLRQAWLIRRRYRGHRVPVAPTSPGENLRVLPAPFLPVPEEQIVNPTKRPRQLFIDDSPLANSAAVSNVLRQSILDLGDSKEQLELGLGLFLDRPFGFAKEPGEPDSTTMLSHEAFSRQIARSRLTLLVEFGAVPDVTFVDVPQGIAWRGAAKSRPGVVSVQDAQLAADDFAYLRTTSRAVRDFGLAYDLPSELSDWLQNERCLILPAMETPSELCIFDVCGCERWRLRLDASQGYVRRAGIETLAAPLIMISPRSAR